MWITPDACPASHFLAMSIRTIFILIFAGFVALLGGLAYVSYLSTQNEKALAASEERRFESYKLADELRQSSDDLTRLARTYVATADPVYEQYFREVLAIRNGKKARPDSYAGIYWDLVLANGEKPNGDGPAVALQSLMRDMQFSDAEFRKLAESEARSNALVLLEEEAMNAIKGRFHDESGRPGLTGKPDMELAQQLMFGEEYHRAKAAIMEPLAEFQMMLDRRTALEVQSLHEKARRYGWLSLGLAGAGLLFTFCAFFALNRRVLNPVRQLAEAAGQVEAGQYGQSVNYVASDELGNLAQSFNHMSSSIEQDISEREKNGVALARAKEIADEANQAKSDFLSNMSHELRTPLNGVLGYVQILQRDRTLGPKQKQSLNSISRCGEHLLNLINDVLDLSKIEAGRLEIATKPTDLSQLIDGVRDIVSPKAESKGLSFRVKISAEVPRGIVTDPIKLRQMLINLLGNSVKFTPEGAVSLRVSEVPKGVLTFEIEDTGIGIGEEKLADIFEPFKQAEGGESEGGTGLGLAISRRIAEALGGSLTATSEFGEGSCFTLTIPLEETDEIKGGHVSGTVPDFDVLFCLPEGESRVVLVADDRETNRDILNQILTGAGFEVVLVDDGDVALERLREREFDIFLCDVRMPRMNGIDVVRDIRSDENLKSSKVIAVTASVFPEFRDKALESGFDDFLMKPLRVAELAETLSRFLEIEFSYPSGEAEQIPQELDPADLFEQLPREAIGKLVEASEIRNLTAMTEIASKLKADENTSLAGQYLEGLVTSFDFLGIEAIVNSLAHEGPES